MRKFDMPSARQTLLGGTRAAVFFLVLMVLVFGMDSVGSLLTRFLCGLS